MKQSLKSALTNSRILAMLCLGFSSGLPLALTGSTLQAWFTEVGVGIVSVGALSLVGMPYVWKFLWAPLMDRFAPPVGGRRKGWIFVMQFSLCVTLLLLATFNPQVQPALMGVIAVFIAILSASQDIAVDAYRAEVLIPEERGIGSAYFNFAYRAAMLVAGALALVVADRYGWRFTYQMMAVLMAVSALVTYWVPAAHETQKSPQDLVGTVTGAFQDLWQRDAVVLLLLFAVFYKIGDAFAATLMTNFLLKGLGFTLTQVGLVYKTVGFIAAIAGALTGGILMMRISLYRALFSFGFAQSFSILLFVVLAVVGKNMACLVVTLFVENFCSGMGTAAFMAFLMSLCHPRYTATQYACLSALAAVGRVFLGPVAGLVVLHCGWVSFYGWAFVASMPGLMILGLLRQKVSFNAKLAEC